MPRRHADSERRLLDAGRALIVREGLRGLRLRAVARRAGVNVGLFPYHFGSKKAFVRRLLQETYEDFFSRLSLESGGEGRPAARLRRALVVFGRFSRDQRRLFVALFAEALQGDKEAVAYLEANVPRHARVVAGLVAQAQEAGELRPLPLPVAVSFALGGMGVPNLMITALERSGSRAAKRGLAGWEKDFLSDAAVERRADLVLAALSR